MPRTLTHFVTKELAGKQFIVVSNREPYVHSRPLTLPPLAMVILKNERNEQ